MTLYEADPRHNDRQDQAMKAEKARKKKATTREKNLCGKTRDIQNPYQIWLAGDWEWRVLKKYQTPSKEAQNQHARWFCAVKSPMTMGSYDLGDVYVSEIKRVATLSLDDLKEKK